MFRQGAVGVAWFHADGLGGESITQCFQEDAARRPHIQHPPRVRRQDLPQIAHLICCAQGLLAQVFGSRFRAGLVDAAIGFSVKRWIRGLGFGAVLKDETAALTDIVAHRKIKRSDFLEKAGLGVTAQRAMWLTFRGMFRH